MWCGPQGITGRVCHGAEGRSQPHHPQARCAAPQTPAPACTPPAWPEPRPAAHDLPPPPPCAPIPHLGLARGPALHGVRLKGVGHVLQRVPQVDRVVLVVEKIHGVLHPGHAPRLLGGRVCKGRHSTAENGRVSGRGTCGASAAPEGSRLWSRAGQRAGAPPSVDRKPRKSHIWPPLLKRETCRGWGSPAAAVGAG